MLRSTTLLFIVGCLVACASTVPRASNDLDTSVVVYGSTPGGIGAALAVARGGGDVVIVTPDSTVGGMTTAGLGWTDVGRLEVVTGIGREFYRRLGDRYRTDDSVWRWQERDDFTFRVQHRRGSKAVDDGSVWVFEPSVAESVLEEMLAEANVSVVHARLDRSEGGTVVEDGRIRSIRLEDGRRVHGRVFVDSTYEGDLFASAGVSFRVGREDNALFGETLNGVQTERAVKHQFPDGIDPWVTPGGPSSGPLPGLDLDEAPDGTGDARVQAYCFRLCLTDHPENRAPFPKPLGYDERDYELLFRLTDAGYKKPWMTFSGMPNRKTDTNNHGPFSSDIIGFSHEWPTASYERRDELFRDHVRRQQGLVWTLANHPRVPEDVRAQFAKWGLAGDEWQDTGNWPPRLYVREARRMIGELTMNEHHCFGREVAPHPVARAAYTIDSHNVRRRISYAGDAPETGWVKNEGDVQVGGFEPFGIGYGAIVPRRAECTNLLVPVALSATHVAFGSIRMEPVFFVLGQSAGEAALDAIARDIDVQDVPEGD